MQQVNIKPLQEPSYGIVSNIFVRPLIRESPSVFASTKVQGLLGNQICRNRVRFLVLFHWEVLELIIEYLLQLCQNFLVLA